jgi:hypothetical protein
MLRVVGKSLFRVGAHVALVLALAKPHSSVLSLALSPSLKLVFASGSVSLHFTEIKVSKCAQVCNPSCNVASSVCQMVNGTSHHATHAGASI